VWNAIYLTTSWFDVKTVVLICFEQYIYISIYLHIYIYTVYVYIYLLCMYIYIHIYILCIYVYISPFWLDVVSLGHVCFTLLCPELRSPTGRFRSPRLGHQPTEPSSNGATYWYRVINHIDIWIYIFINQYLLPIHLPIVQSIVHHFSIYPLVNKHRPRKSPIFNGN
jgi:hypothetical protein